MTLVADPLDGPPPLAPGAELAPGYLALELLRRGNDLDVYDAWSEARGARCVVKTPRPDQLDKPKVRAALLREASLLVGIAHPHIVRGYESIERPVPAAVLETLAGETLGHMVEAGDGLLDQVEAAHLGLQLGSAVRYLHRHGFLHLDLKPSNVIADAGRAKLIDLSLARPPGPARPGIGTWCYMAPEQARGDDLSEAADVWGLGAVLFESLSGEPPFDQDGESESEEADAYPQLERRAPRLARLVAPADGLAELVDGCLEPEPSARPSVPELLLGLATIADLPAIERRWDGAGA